MSHYLYGIMDVVVDSFQHLHNVVQFVLFLRVLYSYFLLFQAESLVSLLYQYIFLPQECKVP